MAIKTFTTGEVLTAANTNTYLTNAGLVYVTTFTATSGTVLNMSSVFNSTYDNYRIIINNFKTTTGDAGITLQLGTGTATATGYYWGGIYLSAYTVTPTVSTYGGGNVSNFETGIVAATTTNAGGAIEIYGPNLATTTSLTSLPADVRTAAGFPRLPITGFQSATTQFTSLHLTCSGTFATITATIYGYRKA